jgi:hypothetical protein
VAGAKERAYFDQAERLYREGKTLEQVSQALLGQVSERTLSDWSAKGEWPRRRAEFVASKQDPLTLLRRLQAKLLAFLEAQEAADPTTLDIGRLTAVADSLAKFDAQIKRIESQKYDRRAVGLEGLRGLVDWLKAASPIKDDQVALAEQERLLSGYLQYLERN